MDSLLLLRNQPMQQRGELREHHQPQQQAQPWFGDQFGSNGDEQKR